MPTDPSVITAMIAAVENDPDNAALRLHLAGLLLEAGRAPEALDHCASLLAKQPAHLDALALAARAADAAGEKIRAEGYRRLYNALAGDRAKSMLESAFGGEPADAPPSREDPPPPARDRRDPEVEPERVSAGGAFMPEEDPGRWETETPDLTLADVAGMEEVKRRLRIAFLAPLQNPEMMRLYGKSLRGGLMLYGPPGCGKTFIARAVAGELGARFIAVGLADVLDMWLGNSERNLHEIFETARRSRPCVLFFDEIDALGQKRSQMTHHGGRTVVNQLLAELDSMSGDNEGVFVLAATNHPWDVDTALRRPGRLDRTLLVLPPDRAAREGALRYHLRERPTQNLDPGRLAEQTDGFSGADIAHLCESAAELAMEDSLATGNVRPIAMGDFKRALKEIKPSTRPWFETARNYALFANEGGVYDDLLHYLRANRLL